MGEPVDVGAIQRHYEALIAALRAKLDKLSVYADMRDLELSECRANLDLVKGQLDADDTRVYDLYMETRAKLEQERNAGDALAQVTDILNSWAREAGVEQAARPNEARYVADRLWALLSTQINQAEARARELEAKLEQAEKLRDEAIRRYDAIRHIDHRAVQAEARAQRLEEALRDAEAILAKHHLRDESVGPEDLPWRDKHRAALAPENPPA